MSNKGKKNTLQRGWLASVSIASALTISSISALAVDIDAEHPDVKDKVYNSAEGYQINGSSPNEAFMIENGFLGGQEDKSGKVTFKSHAPNSKLSHIILNNPLIGKSSEERAEEFIVEASPSGEAVLDGNIFVANLQLLAGSINANNIEVGAGGKTITGSIGPVKLNLKGQTVNFGELQVDNPFTINAQGPLSLKAQVTTASKDGIALNIAEGEVTKSGAWNGDIGFLETTSSEAFSNVQLKDGYNLKGNINGAPGAANIRTGSLIANDATIEGSIGTTVPLSNLVVNKEKTFKVTGKGNLTRDLTLNDNATLIVQDDWTVGRVNTVGEKAKISLLNEKPIKFITTCTPDEAQHSLGDPIDNRVIITGEKDVELGGYGLTLKEIIFQKGATVTLSKGMKLDGTDIVNERNEGPTPTVLLSGGVHNIDRQQLIGAENRLVNIILQDDSTINIKSDNFHATLNTAIDHQGTVNLERMEWERNKVILPGLGSKDKKLKEVNINKDTENYGNTYAYITNVNAHYKAGEIIAGIVKLGPEGTLTFRDQVELVANIENNNGGANIHASPSLVTFEGDSNILGDVGQADKQMDEVNFTGTRKEQKLRGSIYAKIIEFGDNDITLLERNDNKLTTLDGSTYINGNINLGSNKLILDDSTWGPDTSIITTFSNNSQLGSIEVKSGLVVINPHTPTPLSIIVNDEQTLPGEKAERFILINKDIENIDLKSVGQDYAEWTEEREDDKLILVRSNIARKVVKRDIRGAGGDDTDQQNTQNLVSATIGDAVTLTTDMGKIADPKTRGEEGIKNTSGNTEALATMHQAHMSASHSVVLGRLNEAVRPHLTTAGIGAGDEDGPTKAKPGAWAIPIYSHAHQKQKYVSKPSYTVKTLGGIGGLDVALNNNLTLGAAISVINSEVKYKNLKAGDKMSTKTIMLSVYGAHKLTKQLFVEGVASCGSTQIRNRERRQFSFGEQIAKANYGSLAYGGEVLMGYNAVFHNSVLLTPLAGVSYIKSEDEAHTETGTTFANKTIAACNSSRTDGVVGARVSTSMNMANNMIVVPEAHAILSHYVGGKAGKFIATLHGAPKPFSRVNDVVKTIYNLGVSVSSKSNNIEYGLGYDAHLANKYAAHQGSLKVRLNF
ncbi:autotransporter outer membrane beta-barrel domain-containing protein [Candidatus Tisiphia endosymbiont of Beris chalybata]|uniref:autotransporter outer membrane beta-barrel domain-containing protein n=1 Tax=Candidatus Tisiphia endosymbiont of Beris chalybata TaxID=3066262 RepID=UPI00312C9851